MTESRFRQELEELQQRFRTLQELSREDLGQVRESLPEVVAGLHRSLDALQTTVAYGPERERGRARPAARAGSPSKEARPGRGLRFRALSDKSSLLVRIVGAGTRCRWTNRAWLEFTGQGMKQLLGESWLQAVHPADREACVKLCLEAFEQGRLYRVEYRLRRANGEYGWVLEIGTPRLTSRGIVAGYLGTAIEITEQKQAERRLALQYAVARILSEVHSLEEAAAPILETLCEGLGWEVGELWSVDAKEGVPRRAHLWRAPSIEMSELQAAVPEEQGLPRDATPPGQSGSPAWIADIALDQALAREAEARLLGLHGMVRLPISVRGEIHAILRIQSTQVRPRDEAQAEFLGAVSTQIGQFLERLHSADTMQRSEVRKAAILEASLDAVITIDHEGRVVEFNTAAETIFGYRRGDVGGRKVWDLIIPPGLREQALAGFARYRATGESGLLGKRFDASAMRSDGSEFPVEVAVAPIGNGDQPLLTIFVCDATARKTAERKVTLYQERLRSLMADLLLAEERERRQLAADLHDGLSQTIALIQIKLSALRSSIQGKLAQALDEIEELIDQTNRAARSISFELSPPVLHDLGLGPAVQWLAESLQARYGIEILLEDDGQPKPADEKTRVILFRSIRELLINAAKHAGVRRVHVRLAREADRLSAAVEDDGVGMEPDAAAIKGSGLFSIHERLSHVGGSMRIESAPGRGTKIHLCAPLTNGKSTLASMHA